MKEMVINQVNSLRQKAGMTQEGLAAALGITRQTVIAIEKGDYTPSVLLALKIAKYFKRPLEEIFYINLK
jgi:putative transcriptional regulator